MNIASNDVCRRVFFGDEYSFAAGRGTYVQHVLPVFYVKRERGVRRRQRLISNPPFDKQFFQKRIHRNVITRLCFFKFMNDLI